MSDRQLRERLGEIPIDDESGAEERAWRVVSAAYGERYPEAAPRHIRRLVLALAASAVLLGLALTPAGAEVVDAVEEVIGIGEEDAKPALRSLPAAGELLVQSPSGPWIVRGDGSKRLLGDYGDATWSPRGMFVAAADGRQLVAVDPVGQVRWTVTAAGPVRDPRWSPSGYQIAYRSGDDLRVVAADGTADRLLERDAAPIAPAWRPVPETKLQAESGAPGTEQLSFVGADGRPSLVDAISGERIPGPSPAPLDRARYGAIRKIAWSADGERFVTMSERAVLADDPFLPDTGTFNYVATRGASIVDAALAPNHEDLAVLEHGSGRSEIHVLAIARGERSRPGPLFAGPEAITGITWSPDGRWLLTGWRSADQWIFLRADHPRRLVAIDEISRQFDPGDGGGGSFPSVSGWVLPQR
jgi:hypothetical protein